MRGPITAVAAVLLAAGGCLVPEPGPGDLLPSRPAPGPAPTHDGLVYGDPANGRHRLDIYEPDAGFTGPRPLIVYIHGGGWNSGTRTHPRCLPGELCTPLPLSFPEQGYVVASVDYTLVSGTPGDGFPAPVEDVKLAVRWLRDNAGSYGIDPDRVVLMGHSAGGHLAALAALTPGLWEPGPGHETTVTGFVSLAGPADLSAFMTWGGSGNIARDLVMALLPECQGTVPDAACHQAATAASPTTYAAPGDPRGYLVCAVDDPLVPCDQLEALHDALVDANGGDQGAAALDVVHTELDNPHIPDEGLHYTALTTFLQQVTD